VKVRAINRPNSLTINEEIVARTGEEEGQIKRDKDKR